MPYIKARVDPELRTQIEMIAEETGLTLSEVVRRLLEYAVARVAAGDPEPLRLEVEEDA